MSIFHDRTARLFFLLLAPAAIAASAPAARATTYYVSPNGNDQADGHSPHTAWKSLGQIWSVKLKPGDAFLLQRGGVWEESLTVPADGSANAPIVIGAYGQGDRPCIDGGAMLPGAGKDVHVASEGPPPRETCIEISKSFIELRSLCIRHAGRADRGAITVWANTPLRGITIADCTIADNAGRGIWLDGPPNSAIADIRIVANDIDNNLGSGMLIIQANGGRIEKNVLRGNCRNELEPWQAGIRMWSGGVANLTIADNRIADQLWSHGHDSAMGIHCDETGPGVVIADNVIRDVDHAGIEVENTRGVTVEKNIVIDSNIGIMLNRAGHGHAILKNVIVGSRSQGIAIQGWSAHGIDAQPEILVDGHLFTRNRIEGNFCLNSRYESLKAIGGGEFVEPPEGNVFTANDFGPERPGFITWGSRTLDRYDQWPVTGGATNGSK